MHAVGVVVACNLVMRNPIRRCGRPERRRRRGQRRTLRDQFRLGLDEVFGQRVLYAIAPDARGRINAVYMTVVFLRARRDRRWAR